MTETNDCLHLNNKTNADTSDYKVILASASPRRMDILKAHGVSPVIIPSDVDESLPDDIGMNEAVEMLSRRKAIACYDSVKNNPEYSGFLIIAADTIVWKDEIMGKPADAEDAYRMLDKIRGTFHFVVTGVTLIDTDTGNTTVLSDTTEVWCKPYSDDDIYEYLSLGEPYDKAGSYAIQGYFSRHIDHIEGDYENVVGLPFYRIAELIDNYRH